MKSGYDLGSHVQVEKVSMRGPGVVILTGPSSCGKGEIASALCRVMSIETHMSMGEILRNSFQKAKSDTSYANLLAHTYQISKDSNIFDCVDTTKDLSKKVTESLSFLQMYFQRGPMDAFVSQLEWLEYCTMNGLLVPDRWTQSFIAAEIEHTIELRKKPFILDGYPRTVAAAKHLIGFLRKIDIPVIKVLHMSISKQEMLARAMGRGRADDDEASLLSRYNFYVEKVQPSVDYLKMELGSDAIALVDAHQPVYVDKKLDLPSSIENVVASSLRSLGVPRVILRDLIGRVK